MYRTIKLKDLELCPIDIVVESDPDFTNALRLISPKPTFNRRPAEQKPARSKGHGSYIQPSLTQFFQLQNVGNHDTKPDNETMQQDAIIQDSPSPSHILLRGSSTNEIITDFLEQLSRDPSLSSADSLYHLARTLAENGFNDTQMNRRNEPSPLSNSESSVMLKLTQALVSYVTSKNVNTGLPSPDLSAESNASSLSPPADRPPPPSQCLSSSEKQHSVHHRKRFPIPLVVPATSPRRDTTHRKPSAGRSSSPSRFYEHETRSEGRQRGRRSVPDLEVETSSNKKKRAR